MEGFTVSNFIIFCFNFINLSPEKFYADDKSRWELKEFCYSNVTQLFWLQCELYAKSHNVLSLTIIFNNLLADI